MYFYVAHGISSLMGLIRALHIISEANSGLGVIDEVSDEEYDVIDGGYDVIDGGLSSCNRSRNTRGISKISISAVNLESKIVVPK